jgi:SpoIID/LytB domain protein
VPALAPAPAGAEPSLVIQGHGWGHGIGMGQWGALGYALGQDQGAGNWTWQQIVSHYYAPSTVTPLPSDNVNVTIALTENDGQDLIATAPGGVTVPGGGAPVGAALFAPVGGAWLVQVGPGCAGPWTSVGSLSSPTTGAANGGPVQLCQGGGNLTVHGLLQAVYNSSGAARTVNILPLETYVADTVPGESSSGWGTLGGPGPQGQDWGFQELEAQAVAVRSFVESTPHGYGGYADTCDLTCQTYRGTAYENLLTDAAAQDTAGQVMEAGGKVAVTQYSASTGGYTQGYQFNAVPDLGDGICLPQACNPNHDWTATLPYGAVQGAWPQVGTVQSVTVTARDGAGQWGGRVNEVRVTGTGGSVSVTGPQFADTLGLKSDYFAFAGTPSGGVGGDWLAASDGGIFSFGNANYDGSMGGRPLNAPVVGLAPTKDHKGYWEVGSDGGIFSFGDAGFQGSMGGRPLNRPVVGLAADPATGGYWEVASDGGIFNFGAPFDGSTGSLALRAPVVGMAPTPDGQGYWLVASDGGIFTFGDAHFFGSLGALTLDAPVVGMAPTPDGQGYWLVAADGGVFTFGDAHFFGSAAFTTAGPGTVALLPTATAQGYQLVDGSGQVTAFGDAPWFGDLTTAVPGYPGGVVTGVTTPG